MTHRTPKAVKKNILLQLFNIRYRPKWNLSQKYGWSRSFSTSQLDTPPHSATSQAFGLRRLIQNTQPQKNKLVSTRNVKRFARWCNGTQKTVVWEIYKLLSWWVPTQAHFKRGSFCKINNANSKHKDETDINRRSTSKKGTSLRVHINSNTF